MIFTEWSLENGNAAASVAEGLALHYGILTHP